MSNDIESIPHELNGKCLDVRVTWETLKLREKIMLGIRLIEGRVSLSFATEKF